MSDSEHDDEFEAYLKRRLPIHKGATPPDRLEPPPELDRIVIGNARKAIQGASPLRLYRAPKWALAVGLAATTVISFAVVLELGLRAKHAVPVEESLETDLVAEAPTPDGAVAPAPALAAPPVMEEKSASKPAGTARSSGHRAAPRVAKRIKLPAISTTPWPPDATPNTTPPVAADQAGQPDADKARTRLARVEAAASRSRNEPELTKAPTDRAVAESARTSTEGAGTSTEGPGSSTTGTLDEVVVTHKSPAPKARNPVPAVPLHPDPETWLGQIEKLRDAGQIAEAERQIQLFREVYPAWPVPKAVADAAGPADGRAQ